MHREAGAWPLGATPAGGGRCRFCVWAPNSERIDLHLLEPRDCLVEMHPGARGYHHREVEDVQPGTLYRYRLDGGRELPDPASRHQPQGVHGPSAVVEAGFAGGDSGFTGLDLQDFVLYELHVGTFTPEGTFGSVIPHLDELRELGVTALELMPVAQFAGKRNWGYDGVYPYAVQDSYGGPAGLKHLVSECHRRGLAVVLDVVYNHLGPEGNYLEAYGPYFTDRYKTPWGAALNFDGSASDEVRRYFIESAIYFVREFHIDAFRLDAIHAIVDTSATPFLQEFTSRVRDEARRLGRRVCVIAESDLNDCRVIRPVEAGGLGLDAQWSDDFHHALHALLTGERSGYYQDFGRLEELALAYRSAYVFAGQYSEYRCRRHGNSPRDCAPHQFVVCAQNHDQVGNRARGDRLSESLSFAQLKLAASAPLLSPYVPLLFMGEEYGETAPFQYFTDHAQPELVQAVRAGRRREFVGFGWKEGEIPDPQSEETFTRSRLDRNLRRSGRNQKLMELYRELLRLRRQHAALRRLDWNGMEVSSDPGRRILTVRRRSQSERAVLLLAFGEEERALSLWLEAGRWLKALDTESPRWGGDGSPVADTLEGGTEVKLALPPNSCILLVSDGRAR